MDLNDFFTKISTQTLQFCTWAIGSCSHPTAEVRDCFASLELLNGSLASVESCFPKRMFFFFPEAACLVQ